MQKKIQDFIAWAKMKIRLEFGEKKPMYFYERELWWCSIGVNIGFEQDGKNHLFERPVLVVKKFNKDIFWGLPLTRTKRGNSIFYVPLDQGREDSFVILSQLRIMSSKRLLRRMRMIREDEFQMIKKELQNFLK